MSKERKYGLADVRLNRIEMSWSIISTFQVTFSLIFTWNAFAGTQAERAFHEKKLMRYISGKGFACGWELGNEPVDLKGLVNRTITGGQLAEDFQILRALLDKYPEYGNVLIGRTSSHLGMAIKSRCFSRNFFAI